MKLENFCKAKDIDNKPNQQPRDWEKCSLTPQPIEGYYPKLYKELKKLITKNKQTNNPIRNW